MRARAPARSLAVLTVIVIAAAAISLTAFVLNIGGATASAGKGLTVAQTGTNTVPSSKFGASDIQPLVSNANPFDNGVSSSVDLQRDGAVVNSVGAQPIAVAGRTALSSMFVVRSAGSAGFLPNGSVDIRSGSVLQGSRTSDGGNVIVSSNPGAHDTSFTGSIIGLPRLDELRTVATGNSNRGSTDEFLTRLPGSIVPNTGNAGVIVTMLLVLTTLTVMTTRVRGLVVVGINFATNFLASPPKGSAFSPA